MSAGSEVPWCVPAPDQELEQLIEGEGAPIRTLCRTFHVAELWHHAGTTVLTRTGTTYRVADGRLTPMGKRTGDVRMSHDGRLAAWMGLSIGRTNCGVLPLEVYEVATATAVATTEVRAEACGHLAGIDDRGRVFVTPRTTAPVCSTCGCTTPVPRSGRVSPTCPSPRATASSRT